MTVRWKVTGDHLVSHWSNGQNTPSKYDSEWMREASYGEGQGRTYPVDTGVMSPFGAGSWFTHVFTDPATVAGNRIGA